MSICDDLAYLEGLSCDLDNTKGVVSLLIFGICANAPPFHVSSTCHVVFREIERCQAAVDWAIQEVSKRAAAADATREVQASV